MKNVLMRLRAILLLLSLAVGTCGLSRANGIIDPAMRVLDDDFSVAIFVGSTFAPNGTGGGVFGFFNGTGQTITEMTFDTMIKPNIGPSDIAVAFVCNQGNVNPFFQFCSINYVGITGELTIAFWGTNALTGTEGNSNLVGQQKGIPSILPGCSSAPDGPDCTGVGHFAISLSNSFSLDDTVGGWSFADNPSLFNPGQPVFKVSDIQTTFGALPRDVAAPEPATVGMMAGALVLMGWIRRRRRAPSAIGAAASDPENRS